MRYLEKRIVSHGKYTSLAAHGSFPVRLREAALPGSSEEARVELQRWLRVRAGVGAMDPALFLGEERVRLQVGGLGDVVKAAASRVGLHDPAGPLEKRFTPHCCRHWWNTYLFLAGLEERYRGYLRGDVPDGSQGQYIHMDALQKEIKKRYLECIPRLGI